MIIKNPNSLPLIDYRSVKPLQGELKDLSKDNYAKLKKVLDKRGFTAPLFLWQQGDEFYLMDGHQRQRVMLKEDMQPYQVPYILIEAANEQDAKAQLLELTSQYGTITQEGFDAFIVDLPEVEIYEAVHFDALPYLGQSQEVEVEEDEPPVVDESNVVSKLGEIYELGKHRLMCGDSTKDLGELMEHQANLLLTDPPYGVSYADKNAFLNSIARGNLNQTKIENDHQTPNQMKEFWTEAFGHAFAYLADDASFYICSPQGGELLLLLLALYENGYPSRHMIIWNKNNHVLGRSDYNYKHEPLLYGWKEKHTFYGKGKQHNSVWDIAKPLSSKEHPTMKPIELMTECLLNSSKKADIVLDPFGGAGSTLIACEQLDRICYMMELDPKYCDVIRKRYYKFINDTEDGWEAGTPVIGKEAVSHAIS